MEKIFSVSFMAVFISIFFFAVPLFAENNGKKWPVSDQVGMYSYRAKELLGYTSLDGHGKILKRIVIKRDQNNDIIEKIHFDKFNKVTEVSPFLRRLFAGPRVSL